MRIRLLLIILALLLCFTASCSYKSKLYRKGDYIYQKIDSTKDGNYDKVTIWGLKSDRETGVYEYWIHKYKVSIRELDKIINP